MARFEQPVPNVAAPGSAVLYAEQPEPAPLHTVSLQPRVLLAATKDVPPTAVTYADDAGKAAPW
jgi:hypothetical protein